MTVAQHDDALLSFIQEPIFIVTTCGRVLQANPAARRLIGGDPVGHDLSQLVVSSVDHLRAYLRRSSGTATPLVGSIVVTGADGQSLKLRTYCARLRDSDETVRLALRCLVTSTDEFSVLARKVQELNAEIHQRRRAQAALEETLRGNEVLLRELHHRVKNNIQLMMGLFSAARRETQSPEVSSVLASANQRLLAIGTAQQLMYRSQEMDTVPTDLFLTRLCDAIQATLGPDARLVVQAVAGEISNEISFPLALILNELLTNAYKHGLRSGGGLISVTLERIGDEYELIVRDDGPGFVASTGERRSSGLGLVRGLCRQIGAALSVENNDGARFSVRFTDQQSGR
jgi:two-component sensor histidine kinase